MKSLIPHVAPLVLYVAIGAAAAGALPWADPVRVVVVAALLVLLARRGAYPELRVLPPARYSALGVAAGLAVGISWVPLATIVPPLADAVRTGLDPAQNLGLTAFRIAGMVAVVPIAEELCVRSAVPRLVDSGMDEDWRARPVGAFTWTSAAVSVGFFTLAHPAEWLAALATGVLWTALLALTRNLRVVVVSHAVANAWLAGHVLVTGETRWW